LDSAITKIGLTFMKSLHLDLRP